MPAERVSMRKIRDVLRLTHAMGMSRRVVGEVTGIGKTAVGDYVRRASAVGLNWPIPEEIDDAELERRLFAPMDAAVSDAARSEPDWPHIQAELKRRGVTLTLLWQEYRTEHPQGCAYSWFCEQYGAWRKSLAPTMRQTHLAGEKLFVDWAGDTVALFDAATGEKRHAHIFVAALGASNYTYAEARWSEKLPDWIGAHVNLLAAIGGVPSALVPDNLKAGITKPSRYEPGINRTYQDLADHYGCVVLPTRIRHPRDKAKVEVAVQIVERFVVAKLRNRTFFSLAELNAAISDCVAAINNKIMRHVGKSRAELLDTLDQPALKPLPATPYSYARAGRARLSHRDCRPLLLGPIEADPRDRRSPHHQRNGRDIPQRPADREPCILSCSQSPHHDRRAHAECASPLRRMDAGKDDGRGRQGRHRDGRFV
jgi:transposase